MAARLLIAEDDDELRALFATALLAAGFEVASAADGRQALEHLEAGERYDLLLLDDEMPRLTGRQLLKRIRADGFTVDALLVSGNPSISEQECSLLGVRLLRKPLKSSALIQAVRQVIGARRGLSPTDI